MSSELLIAAAFEPELDFLEPELRAASAVTGIGSVAAAAKLGSVIAERKIRRVLFVGSIGAKANSAALLSFVAPERVKLADLALADRHSYLPAAAVTTFEADATFLNKLLALSLNPIAAAVYSPAGISNESSCAEKLSKFAGADFENLELFGIAAACSAQGIPWNALCCVTNYLGPQAHEQWKGNFKDAARRTADALAELLLIAEY